jgi:hypothetical protein
LVIPIETPEERGQITALLGILCLSKGLLWALRHRPTYK